MTCSIFMRKREKIVVWSLRTEFAGYLTSAVTHAEKLLTQDLNQGLAADLMEVLIVEHGDNGVEQVVTFEATSGKIALVPA